MQLFTPGRDERLNCDAYLIDTARQSRGFTIEPETELEDLVDALLDRVVLMGRSMYSVRNRTFALFFDLTGSHFSIAVTAPYSAEVLSTLHDALDDFGLVEPSPDAALSDGKLKPMLAYERGRVSFFDTPETRPFRALAGKRGMRMLSATTTHAPDPDVKISELSAPEYLEAQQRPPPVELDLAAIGEMSPEELEALLKQQLEARRQQEDRQP